MAIFSWMFVYLCSLFGRHFKYTYIYISMYNIYLTYSADHFFLAVIYYNFHSRCTQTNTRRWLSLIEVIERHLKFNMYLCMYVRKYIYTYVGSEYMYSSLYEASINLKNGVTEFKNCIFYYLVYI